MSEQRILYRIDYKSDIKLNIYTRILLENKQLVPVEPSDPCPQCGGQIARIRGRVPGAPDREVCPTCLVETMERLVTQQPQEDSEGGQR